MREPHWTPSSPDGQLEDSLSIFPLEDPFSDPFGDLLGSRPPAIAFSDPSVRATPRSVDTVVELEQLRKSIDEFLARANDVIQRAEDMAARHDHLEAQQDSERRLVTTEARLAKAEDALQQIQDRLATLTQERATPLESRLPLASIPRLVAEGGTGAAPDVMGRTQPRAHDGRWVRPVAVRRVLDTSRWLARHGASTAAVLATVAVVANVRTDATPSPQLVSSDGVDVQLVEADVTPPVEVLPEPSPVEPAPAPKRAPVATRAPGPFVGTLLVDSDPAGAAVFVNGQHAGSTPLRLPDRRVGSLALLVSLDGYRRWSRAVQVGAGRVTRVDANLQPLPARNASLQAPDVR